MKIQMVAKSEVGKVRKINEDYCGIFKEDNLAILCDGMGGHQAGAHASRLAVSTTRYMYTFLNKNTLLKITDDLDEAHKDIAARLVGSIRLANRHIYNLGQKEKHYRGMGTTVSALLLKENNACICHVGDSRIYRLCDNKLELLTEDHSWINELIQDNEINQDEISRFEKKNVITRALGLSPSVKIDLKLLPIKSKDIFLLCSDGLTNGLTDSEIKRIILSNKDDLESALSELIDAANFKDGSDNITVSLVAITENNSFEKSLLPASVTLKAENKDVSLLEDKILRQEFSNRNSVEKFVNILQKFWKKKYSKAFAVAALLLVTIAFVKYSFTDNTNKHNLAVSNEANIIKSADITKKSHKKYIQTNNPVDNSELATHPDSVINQENLLTNSITQSDKILTKSLNRTSRNRGLIYLVGLDNLVRNQNTYLFLNNRLLGNTDDYFDNGIRVRPGGYEIAIKDTNNKTLFKHDTIWISAGDIKAIEFNIRNRNR